MLQYNIEIRAIHIIRNKGKDIINVSFRNNDTNQYYTINDITIDRLINEKHLIQDISKKLNGVMVNVKARSFITDRIREIRHKQFKNK